MLIFLYFVRESAQCDDKLVILRTMAQMSLEQSINCNFITPGLAQAALVSLSLFPGSSQDLMTDPYYRYRFS